MDKIQLNKLAFYGYHGDTKEENVLGQRFLVDLELHMDLKKPGKSDELEDSINYAEVFEITKDIVEKERFKLIEALAERIAHDLLAAYPALSATTIRVIKPDPPIVGHYKSVAVEIYREREEQ